MFGFGVVGHGLHHVLHETHGIKAEIKKICVKDPRKERTLPFGQFTFNADDLLEDPEIDTIVELINDADAAFDILKRSLAGGKAVVTANKRMVAEHLEEICKLQRKYRLPVLYEGAVCASIPIIRNLEEYYDNDLISSVEGIFNGSTNYILTRVFEENKSYEEALGQAQELGFAETDPSLDVKGFDPAFKLSIMIAHAFGVFVRPDEIINIGIDHLTETDFRHADRNGYTIKLIARAQKADRKVIGHVTPQFIERDHPLAGIRNEYNAVLVEGAFSEKQLFVGKGAGSYPTGSAVLSDISALTYGYRYEYKKFKQEKNLQFESDRLVGACVSFEPDSGSVPKNSDWKVHHEGSRHHIHELIRLSELQRWSTSRDVSVILDQPQEDRFDQVPRSEREGLKIA